MASTRDWTIDSSMNPWLAAVLLAALPLSMAACGHAADSGPGVSDGGVGNDDAGDDDAGGSPSGLAVGPLIQLNRSASGVSANAAVLANAALSPDGTMVIFWSRATNLVPGVVDGNLHLFLKVLATGEIAVLDTTSTGELANDTGSSDADRAAVWRPDGTEILFSSHATNLVPSLDLGSIGWGPYLYSMSLVDGSVGFIALRTTEAAWSPDGTKIAFVSGYEYGPGANNGTDVYVWTVGAPNGPDGHPFVLVSSDASGALPTHTPSDSYRVVWSPDSARIAFTSYASDLVPGDTNAATDIFIKTLSSGAIERASVSGAGDQANAGSDWPAWSPDGARLAFNSDADDLVSGDSNPSADIFVKELATGAVTLLSVARDGAPALLPHQAPRWSPDGARIAFVSASVGLLAQPVDANQREDVYVKTLATGEVMLLSTTAEGGTGNGASTTWNLGGSSGGWLPGGDGFLFVSRSTNFDTQDGNAFEQDLFLKQL